MLERLTGALRRAPSVDELASCCGWSRTEADEAILALRTHRLSGRQALDELEERSVGSVEDDLDTVDDRLVLADLFDGLASRERRIIALRYFGELTQSKIAERVGVSQMHVSRLLRQSLANLRTAASEHALASSR